MAQVTVYPQHDDLPRGGLSRAVAGLTAVMALHTLNHAISQPSCAKGTDPTKATAQQAFLYTVTGQILIMDPAGADLFDLTGLTPVRPGLYQKLLFLVDRDENVKVQECVPSTELRNVGLTNVSPNPWEAVANLLNGPPSGWCIIGSCALHVADSSLTPWTPGVDDLDTGAILDAVDFIDGFDGTLLLPFVGDSPTQIAGF